MHAPANGLFRRRFNEVPHPPRHLYRIYSEHSDLIVVELTVIYIPWFYTFVILISTSFNEPIAAIVVWANVLAVMLTLWTKYKSLQETYGMKKQEHNAELQRKEDEMRQMFVVRVKEKELELKEAEKEANQPFEIFLSVAYSIK